MKLPKEVRQEMADRYRKIKDEAAEQFVQGLQCHRHDCQATRAEAEQLRLNVLKCGCHHPGYIIGIHWLSVAYGRICAGEPEAEVMADYGYGRLPVNTPEGRADG